MNNRYYSNAYGRFMTPDPYDGSARPTNPQSWNRYPYVLGDPVNGKDPSGLFWADPETPYVCGDCIGSGGNYCDPSIADCVDSCAGDDGSSICSPNDVQPQQDYVAQCSITLYERPAGGTIGNHTYLDVSETVGTSTIVNDVLEGDPSINKPWWQKLNPYGGNWGTLTGYIEPVAAGNFQGATNPATNQFVASDTGGGIVCLEVWNLIFDVQLYQSSPQVPYLPIPIKTGYYNSNSFTFTLLSQFTDLLNPGGFPTPPGWNPGWGKFVPGL